jgi:hypothetical protein
LRARVLAQARADAAGSGAARRAAARWRTASALAASVALVLGWQLFRDVDRARHQRDELAALVHTNTELAARLQEQDHALVGLREALATQAQVLRVLAGPRTVTAALSATPQGGQATGRVVVDPRSGETAVVLAGLQPAPAGRVYELWAIRGEKPAAGARRSAARRRRGADHRPAGRAPGGGHRLRGVARAGGRVAVADRTDRARRAGRELSARSGRGPVAGPPASAASASRGCNGGAPAVPESGYARAPTLRDYGRQAWRASCFALSDGTSDLPS